MPDGSVKCVVVLVVAVGGGGGGGEFATTLLLLQLPHHHTYTLVHNNKNTEPNPSAKEAGTAMESSFIKLRFLRLLSDDVVISYLHLFIYKYGCGVVANNRIKFFNIHKEIGNK